MLAIFGNHDFLLADQIEVARNTSLKFFLTHNRCTALSSVEWIPAHIGILPSLSRNFDTAVAKPQRNATLVITQPSSHSYPKGTKCCI
jgi:hypothetical protein